MLRSPFDCMRGWLNCGHDETIVASIMFKPCDNFIRDRRRQMNSRSKLFGNLCVRSERLKVANKSEQQVLVNIWRTLILLRGGFVTRHDQKLEVVVIRANCL